jgi:hypothetical protein
MASYKNIRIKKKGGGTRIQRVQVLASGKYKFVKNTGSKSNRKASSKTKTKRRTNRVAREKKRRSSRSFTLPLAVLGGVVAGIARPSPRGPSLVESLLKGDWKALAYDGREVLAGVDNTGKFRPEWIVATYGPMIAGALIHKFVGGKLGVNAMLGRAGVPLIRV